MFCDDGLARIEARTMARTQKGRLALVPDGSRIRDIVTVCKGIRMPLVLRNTSTSDRSQIFGESYVYGVMNGKKAYDENQCRRLTIV